MTKTFIQVRLSSEQYQKIELLAHELGLNKSKIVRFLLNKSIKTLHDDSIRAGGLDKLQFNIREFL